jgi:phosphatidylglycerol:prolipoprotein diacylglycerol transferase
MIRLPAYPALHPLFEALGYLLGFATYKYLRRRSGDLLDEPQRWSIVAAAAIGAMLGSRVLGLLEQAPRMHPTLAQMLTPGGGKTIVGGLLGGWIAAEILKKMQGIRTRAGDLFALPLCVGIATGRVGCLLAGLADDTYGKPTSLPWGVDFGDGVARHPTQAYEILFLTGLGFALWQMGRKPHAEGSLFRVFMASYLAWRLVIDFLKPQPLVCGLNMIQWACVGGLCFLGIDFLKARVSAVPEDGEEYV